jgi:hypothetical protein
MEIMKASPTLNVAEASFRIDMLHLGLVGNLPFLWAAGVLHTAQQQEACALCGATFTAGGLFPAVSVRIEGRHGRVMGHCVCNRCCADGIPTDRIVENVRTAMESAEAAPVDDAALAEAAELLTDAGWYVEAPPAEASPPGSRH